MISFVAGNGVCVCVWFVKAQRRREGHSAGHPKLTVDCAEYMIVTPIVGSCGRAVEKTGSEFGMT